MVDKKTAKHAMKESTHEKHAHTVEKHVVKRKGHLEKFDRKKLYASVYWACKTTGMSEKEAEVLSQQVLREVEEWIHHKTVTTSDAIFVFVGEKLKSYNKHASYMYSTIRDIS